jgi:hypothetical protein
MYLQDLSTNGQTVSGWSVGKTKRSGAPYNRNDASDPGWEKINGQPSYVAPINKATAALYTYTPWVGGPTGVGGNYLFWTLWNKYWGQKIVYPDGTLLQATQEPGKYWLIQDGKRRQFNSKSVFLSNYNENQIITTDIKVLEAYTISSPIKYPNYSLLQSKAKDKTIYLLVDDTKRKFDSRATFAKFGYNPEEIIPVDQQELDQYVDGEILTTKEIYPNGTLIQDSKTGGIYLVQSSIKHPIIDRQLITLYYRGRKTKPMTTKDLDKIITGDPIKLKNGTLTKAESSPIVYFISNGKKLPITSETTFNLLGYKFSNVIVVSDKILSLHELGQEIGAGNSSNTMEQINPSINTNQTN